MLARATLLKTGKSGCSMTKSMTAFSRGADEQDWGALVWELRSVNHRYLDVVIKLPEELRAIENEVRSRLSKKVKRGKIECQLRYRASLTAQSEININEAYTKALLKACQVISKRLHQPSEMNVFEILRWPGVVEEPEQDLGSVIESAHALFDSTLDDLLQVRESEGQRLQQLIESRCESMKEIVMAVRDRLPAVRDNIRNKIMSRLEELNVTVDQDRYEQEIVYLLQKADVDEELDRLDSHFVEVGQIFKRNEPVGRRLDFLMQEFNREANTLGSKSCDIETTQASMELKVLIEQMREQVQNIE